MSTSHSDDTAATDAGAVQNAFSAALGDGKWPSRQQLAAELAAARDEIAALNKALDAEQATVRRLNRDKQELALRAAIATNLANENQAAHDLLRTELERMGFDADEIELRVAAHELGVDLGQATP